jgi:UBX domain-containing protein 1/4
VTLLVLQAPSAATAAPVKRALRAVDPALLAQLTGDMGFPEHRAQRALVYAPQPGLEACINWLMEHQEDADIDEPLSAEAIEVGGGGSAEQQAAAAAAASLKCDDCGALLRDTTAAELHAHKTGHSNFSESTVEVILYY